METQNVQPNRIGHYTVTMGSTTSQGLPTSVFASGEARWLGVQPEGQAEQPRVLLLSVPYAKFKQFWNVVGAGQQQHRRTYVEHHFQRAVATLKVLEILELRT